MSPSQILDVFEKDLVRFEEKRGLSLSPSLKLGKKWAHGKNRIVNKEERGIPMCECFRIREKFRVEPHHVVERGVEIARCMHWPGAIKRSGQVDPSSCSDLYPEAKHILCFALPL